MLKLIDESDVSCTLSVSFVQLANFEESFTAHMPLLMATSVLRLGRRRQSSHERCYMQPILVIYIDTITKPTSLSVTVGVADWAWSTHA